MKIEVKRDKFESIGIKNLSQIAHESLAHSTANEEGNSVENIKEWLLRNQKIFTPSATLLAYLKEDLVGWLCVETSDNGIAEIWRWQPFITPRVDRSKVTVELLTRAIDFARDKQQSRLEICFDGISSNIRDEYEKMKHWYAIAGLKSIGETVYLARDLYNMQTDSFSAVLPSGYEFKLIGDIEEEQLYNCYKTTFMNSNDRFFHSLSEKHQYDDYKRRLQLSATSRASTALMKDGKIIGFAFVQVRPNEGHLAKLGILPGYRKKGFGKKLLLKSINGVISHGKERMTVGVDITNQPALSLYKKAGFKPVNHFITHAWKIDDLKSIDREFLTI